ncbi:hypothetical protein [Shewanella algae]|uniref:hypothetical protein n=1 Tax=Shewanella algae TaxID=38313 RepID=UPI0011835FC1|nr:hypothetical protein [Shewanella algae]TVL14781.1 hypothetical protein AYJ02_12005 [Shewanella algae]
MSTAKERNAFQHLLKHFRNAKIELIRQGSTMPDSGLQYWYGVLDCLYWQALGLGVLNLAKGIRRYTIKIGLYREVKQA